VDVEYLRLLQASLAPTETDDQALRERLERNLVQLERFAQSWQAAALASHPALGRFVSDASGNQLIDLGPLCLTQVQPVL